MRKTQIYLPDELYEAVRRVSYEQRKSIAQVVREALVEYLLVQPEQREVEANAGQADTPLHKLGKLRYSGGKPDGSIHHDRYLYGGE